MRYLNPLRYIHYHTQLAIPTIYDDSLSFYEIMNKTNLHFNEVINDMNENYEIIDKAFQEVLEQTNKWMEEAKAQADRAEQEANKSQASAEDAKNQADRASSEADAAAASALEAQKQADRASSEADRAHTEAENAKAQAQAAANSAQESATSAAASAGSASESAASATESKKSADASAASATESKNSADASANSASQSAASATASQNSAVASANSASQSAASATASQNSAVASANSASQSAASATASQNSAVASANSASQAAQSATDAANSAKEAADTLDEAKETFVKKAGDTMSGKLTISYGGLSVDGSAGVTGDFNTGRLQVGTTSEKGNTYLYGDLDLNGILTMSLGGNSALAFSDLTEGLKLYAPLSFEPSPLNISNVANPQEALDAVNKQTLDSEVSSINASLTQVNEKITSLTSRVDTAENNIKTNTSNITSLTSRVDKTETDITSLTTRVTTNESNISSINTEISNIKQDITTVEGDYVKKAGDTMTGNLTMGLNQIVMDTGHIAAGNNTLLFEGYPEIDVDGAKISMVADPVDVMDATNKKYVDDAVANVNPTGDYLPLTGGTMSGDINMGVNNSVRFGAANYALYQNEGTGHLVLTGNSNTDIVEMNNIGTLQFGNKTTIQNVNTPKNNGDAAPKSYVDGQIAVAKNDVYGQIQNYLPLTGGTLTGAVRFGTTASIGELVDFGLVAKMDSGNLGIVTQSIIHTNNSTSTDGVTYTLANVDSDIHYTCAGNGVKQMNIGSFETVKVSSSLLVAEDPTQNMQVATKQYVDQHAGGGGSKVDLGGNYIMILTPLTSKYSKFEIFVATTANLTFKIDGSKIQTQQLQVPYTYFLNNNNLELNQNDSVRYFIQTFKDNTTNSNIALSTYFKNTLPNTVYLEFTNLSTTHTEGMYYIYGGGKIMECLVETKKIIS
jgi:multidrug efflux pump subunit AcrA (membrane-fusion protein)